MKEKDKKEQLHKWEVLVDGADSLREVESSLPLEVSKKEDGGLLPRWKDKTGQSNVDQEPLMPASVQL
jgi:hypothetical protein